MYIIDFIQNEKFLPTVGIEPTTSRFLGWWTYQLHHGTAVYRLTIGFIGKICLHILLLMVTTPVGWLWPSYVGPLSLCNRTGL